MTDGERQAALEQIADEVRVCTRCRLHEQRTRSVPGEGNPDTEVVFVGEGPGFNEDREGRPFVGRAGGLLVKLLASVGWGRDDVFITNVVKCRPPENRDPEADEIAACAPFLRRQLEALDPALVVTLGRYSMGSFMPGARISSAHGTVRPVDPASGASDALAYAMYHPAAALRSTEVEQASFRDMAGVPRALLQSRDGREARAGERAAADAAAPAMSEAGLAAETLQVGLAAGTQEAGLAAGTQEVGLATGTPEAVRAPVGAGLASAGAVLQEGLTEGHLAIVEAAAPADHTIASPEGVSDAVERSTAAGSGIGVAELATSKPSGNEAALSPAASTAARPAAASTAARPIAAPTAAPTAEDVPNPIGTMAAAPAAAPTATLPMPPLDSEATTSTDQMTLF